MIGVVFLGRATSDEQEQGRTVVPKQCKKYRKKDPQPKLVEDPIDKLNIDAPGGRVTHE